MSKVLKITWYSGEGIDKYLYDLAKLEESGSIKAAVYEGAAIVANSIAHNINDLPIRKGNEVRGVTKKQKEGLKEGFGISPMRNDNGYIHVKLGFADYNEQYSSKYPNGQPNAMIARSIEGGTSWSPKIPFIRKAVRATENEAVARMTKVIDTSLENYFG